MNQLVQRPRRRTSATPASAPMTTAIRVEPMAALNELTNVLLSDLLSNSSRYHLRPPHSFQMLKLLPPFIEWMITYTIGINRKITTNAGPQCAQPRDTGRSEWRRRRTGGVAGSHDAADVDAPIEAEEILDQPDDQAGHRHHRQDQQDHHHRGSRTLAECLDPAPQSCRSIAPIMLPFAPPRMVAVT